MSERIYFTDSESIEGALEGKRVLDAQPRIDDESALDACLEELEPLINRYGMAIVTVCASKYAFWVSGILAKHEQTQSDAVTANAISEAMIGMAIFFDQFGFALTNESQGGDE
jgi:hypothetical protein